MRRLVDASRVRIPVSVRSWPRWSRRIPTRITHGIGHDHAWVFMDSIGNKAVNPKLAESAPNPTHHRDCAMGSGSVADARQYAPRLVGDAEPRRERRGRRRLPYDGGQLKMATRSPGRCRASVGAQNAARECALSRARPPCLASKLQCSTCQVATPSSRRKLGAIRMTRIRNPVLHLRLQVSTDIRIGHVFRS